MFINKTLEPFRNLIISSDRRQIAVMERRKVNVCLLFKSVSVCSPKSVKPAMCKLKSFQSKIQLECMQIEFSKVSIS